MIRLSSKMTFYVKKIFPAFLSAFVLLLIVLFGREIVLNGFSMKHLPFLTFLVMLAGGAYWLLTRFCLPVLDKVLLVDQDLHIHNWGDEVRIPVSDVTGLSSRYGQYLVLKLREEYPFKQEMMFLPKLQLLNPSFHEDIKNLTERIPFHKD
ncbi:MAG: hypothetical protein AAFP70_03000 [Calditrichota bacterium]